MRDVLDRAQYEYKTDILISNRSYVHLSLFTCNFPIKL
jgi:hypothetical protein